MQSSPLLIPEAKRPKIDGLGVARSPHEMSTSPQEGGLMAWSNMDIPGMLRVSLTTGRTAGRIPLPKLGAELQAEGISVTQKIERIVMAVFSLPQLPNPFGDLMTYVLKCYTRTIEEKNVTYDRDPEKLRIINVIIDQLVSYTSMLLRIPKSFPNHGVEYGPKLFVTKLIEGDGIPNHFINHLVDHLKTEGVLQEVFEQIFLGLKERVLMASTFDEFTPPTRVLSQLVINKFLAGVLVSMSSWLPPLGATPGKDIESKSILGPFFRLSSLSAQFFDRPLASQTNEPHLITHSRNCIRATQRSCHEVLLTLLKARETRDSVLDWIGAVVTRNKDRRRPSDLSLCSEGFLINFVTVMLKLCEPFMNLENPKSNFTLIDATYLLKYNRFDIGENTAIAFTQAESNAFAARIKPPTADTKPNFTTECFFGTSQAFQLGIFRLFNYFIRLLENPGLGEDDRKRRIQVKTSLCDPEFLTLCWRFFNLNAAFLLRTATGGEVIPTKLPLQKPIPPAWCALPEHLLEGMLEFIDFMMDLEPKLLESESSKTIMALFTTFIASPAYINNPHLRIQLVSTLQQFAPKSKASWRFSVDPFTASGLAQNYLGGALLRFYVEIERTGASSQFFDKFSARLHVALIMKHIWKIESYRLSFKEQFQKADITDFFVNMIISDTIYLLDEGFSSLIEIHLYQELSTSGALEQLEDHERAERQNAFNQAERIVPNYLTLGGAAIRMLAMITKDMAQFFVQSQVSTERIAQMLSNYLVRLAGPRHHDLDVNNPQKYRFNPKWLLKKIATMYLNFMAFPNFVDAVAGDGRTFDKKTFTDAGAQLKAQNLLVGDKVPSFNRFIDAVAKRAQEKMTAEEDLGDIPDEFLDPIMSTFMTDPVKLPSGNTVDRATIERHLLSQSNDPFNRAPLTIDKLVPDTEMKAKIDAFLQSKKK